MKIDPKKQDSPRSSDEGHLQNPVYNADEFHRVHGKPLGLAALVVLVFYGVSGGPFGVEPAVAAGGPLVALAGFILLQIVWSIPEAMITAELSTAFPEASGFVAWVTTAYGPFWGFMEGYLSWLSGVTDNALYPILFLRYLVALLGEDSLIAQGFYKWAFVGGTTIVLTYLNYRGLEIVGKSAIFICVLSLLPFAIFVIVGAFKVEPSRWFDLPEGGAGEIEWTKYMNIMFWNLNYWDSAASFAGEVQDPGRTFPKAMLYAILLVVVSSFLPVLVGTGAFKGNYKHWEAGYFVTLAEQVAGKWLSYFMLFGAAISNIGMFEGTDEMLGHVLGQILSRRNRHGTPPYAILLSAIGVLGLGWLSFEEIVELLNLLYCFAQTLEFAAFLQLRRKFPDLIRPYKIPLGLWGLYAMLFFPMLFLIFIISLASMATLIFSCIAVVVGAGLYGLMEYMKAHKWCEFENQFADQENMLVKLAEAQEQIIADELTEGGIAMSDLDEFPESLQHELSLLHHDDEEQQSYMDGRQEMFGNGYARVSQFDDAQVDREDPWQANGPSSYGALDRSQSL